MHTLATTVLTIGLQLALGALVSASAVALFPASLRGLDGDRRRVAAVRSRAAARMMRSLPLAVGLALGGGAALVALGVDPRALLTRFGFPVLLVTGLISTSGAYLMHDAARTEASGRLRVARRQARLGGRLMFWGVPVLLAGTGIRLLLQPESRRSLLHGTSTATLIPAVGVMALCAAAVIALLAGLTRKPRPSGDFAVWLYLCGLIGLLRAIGPIG